MAGSTKIQDRTIPAKNKVYSDYRSRSRRRGIPFSLTFEQFTALAEQECHYCPDSHTNTATTTAGACWRYNGLDRKDNDKGYEPGNVVPCCWPCNLLKGEMPYDQFMRQISRIHKKQEQFHRHYTVVFCLY